MKMTDHTRSVLEREANACRTQIGCLNRDLEELEKRVKDLEELEKRVAAAKAQRAEFSRQLVNILQDLAE